MYWWFARGGVRRTWVVSATCLGIVIGLALVRIGVFMNGWVLPVIALVMLVLCFRLPRVAVLVALSAGLLLGGWQGSRIERQSGALKKYEGVGVTLAGEITGDPTRGKRDEWQFQLTNTVIEGRRIPGTLWVSSRFDGTLRRGDMVELRGKIKPGMGPYQATINYADISRRSYSDDPILTLRDRFADSVKNIISEPAASLGLGFLLGQRASLPDELEENMRIVGLTHIVVASGYNLTILVRAARRFLAGTSKYLAFTGSMGLMLGFVSVTGLSPSMTRASLVTGLSLVAWYYGRKIHPIVLILFVAALTALINPFFLWADIGWYLSFLAFAGVLILAPLLTARLYRDRRPAFLVQVAIETIAAQLLTLPLILWIFGDFSVFALIANVLVVPLVPLVMLSTFLGGLIGMASPLLGGVLGLPAQLIMEYMISQINYFARIEWSVFALPISVTAMIVLYGAIIGLCIGLRRRTKYNLLNSQITD